MTSLRKRISSFTTSKPLVELTQLPELLLVDNIIKLKLESEAAVLHDLSSYLLSLGGKRIRPAITLAVAKTLGMSSPSPELIDVAAAIELIHMATLLHDDIIDNATLRRGKESPLKIYGSTNTLLTGDFLLVRAFSLCARLDQTIVAATEKACIALTEGEVLEECLPDRLHTLESALDIARKKTASLFSLGSFCAAHLSNVSPEIEQLLFNFGDNLGISFQILDDILDVVGEEDSLGKKVGTDIRQRKPSVINILWLQVGSPLSKRLLAPHRPDDEQYIDDALSEIKQCSVITSARDLAREFANKAKEALNKVEGLLPNYSSSGMEMLRSLVDYVVDRTV